MDMKGIDGTSSMGNAPNVEGAGKDGGKREQGGKAGPRGDRVELSEEARQLLADTEDIGAARETVMEAARKKLLTGDLLNSDALRRAAENLLNSGDLDEAGEA